MKPLVVHPQPAGDLPGDIAPQRADGLPVRQALQRLQHHHRGDHRSGHRRVPTTLAGDIGEQLRREQLVAVVGKKGIHRPMGDQMTAPPTGVHLVIGGMACWTHTRSLPSRSQQRELQDRYKGETALFTDLRDRGLRTTARAPCLRSNLPAEGVTRTRPRSQATERPRVPGTTSRAATPQLAHCG